MKRVLKIALRVVVVVALVAAVVGFLKREEIARLLAVNSLFSEEKIVANFSHMDRAFLNVELGRGDGPISPLPEGTRAALPDGIDDWITARSITALLVLKDGQIVAEDYYLGTTPDDRRISWSVAKSYLSALIGMLHHDGTIPDLDVPVTQYAPMLEGSAYADATIRDVLQMSSGVTFDEDYLDYNSDINRMGREIALGGSLDEFAAGLKESDGPAGEAWQYVSIDTHVIGMVVRGATGRSIPDLLSEKIIVPLGLEQPPYYITDGDGVAFVLGGLNLTTRDYARFGLMYEQGGEYGGQRIVPEDWVTESTLPSAKTEPGKIGYGYQWWIPQGGPAGEFMARGVYGQYIYIDQGRDVVIVVNAADRKFREPGVADSYIAMFRQIAGTL